MGQVSYRRQYSYVARRPSALYHPPATLGQLPPKTAKSVDITKAVLARTHGGESVGVWIVFEVDPDCQRFPARYELDIYDGLITRFVEQYSKCIDSSYY